MKKNISINLQGMIFHIEEDGYEVLLQYLNSIKRYFANYPGHQEIIADIESRMAEIFYTKLTPSKQVITLDDVEALIRKMGSVNDFAQIEEDEDQPQAGAYAGSDNGYSSTASAGPKKLTRDVNRKVIAGVAAGIANYMGTDPLWIRLVFLVLLLIGFGTAGFSAGLVMLFYVLCWLALPVSYSSPTETLPEDTTSKRLYRNPDDKKLGGVCSGLALYLGMDPTVMRLLFLVLFFTGPGLPLYIILWIILPEAKTVTDKARMQGKPLTLSGIESSLKASLQPDGVTQEESPLVRLILLPVRLIAQILEVLSRLLGPILSVLLVLVRVFAGILLLVLALGAIISLVGLFAASFGYLSGTGMVNLDGRPASYFFGDYPLTGKIAALFTGLIPAFFLVMLAIGLLAKRFYLKATLGWTLFALWLLSGFIFIITLISYQNNFAEDGEFTTEKTFSTAAYQTISLDANKIKGGNYKQFDINVESYPGTEVRLLQTFGAEGNSEEDAIEHARSISYRAVQKDSSITLDNGFTLRPNALYRDQHLTVTLQLPETKNYRISQDLARLLPASAFNENYSNAQIARHTWQLRNNLFSCLTCTAQDTIELNRRNNRGLDHDRNGAGFLRDESDFGTDTRAIPARNFKKISVVGPFYVKIVTAENIAVEARGEMDDLNKIKYEVENGELKIYPRRSGLNFGNKMEPVHLSISLPELTQLSLVGATTAELSGFEGGSLKLKQTGATKCYLKADLRRLDVNLTGASEAILVGKADFLDANLVGGCQLKAGEFSVGTADIDVVGGSEADVYVTRRLKADVSSGSELTYRGNPAETDIDQSSGGEARKNRQHSN